MHFFRRKAPSLSAGEILPAERLHLGCGPVHLDGWTNIDNQQYPGVDYIHDLRNGLPFRKVKYIFAEHFIEHIPYEGTQELLRECRRVLVSDGVLRLTTPNLDWVWATHYRAEMNEDVAMTACFAMNRAFHGWGHQFLYNEATLRATLFGAGFSRVDRVEYGESTHEALRGVEHHPKSDDFGSLSHILIVEASGRGGKFPQSAKEIRGEFLRDVKLR
jgi:predicted SAM-dependent methyltransferase